MIFPWQLSTWQTFQDLKRNAHLPHALLFSGIPGLGKTQFAENLARLFLCMNEKTLLVEQKCDCHACRLILGKVHPNILWITPEKEAHAIKVDQIRVANEFAQQSSLQGEYRFIIINPADNVNMNAANALLKTLEEPASGTILILINHQRATLPATIISRCQCINFMVPEKALALSWLQQQILDPQHDKELLLDLAHGAPLAALELIQNEKLLLRQTLYQNLSSLLNQENDPIKMIADLPEHTLIDFIDLILSWIIDIVSLQLQKDQIWMCNSDYALIFSQIKNQTDMQKNIKFMQYLQSLRKEIVRGINLNKQLATENILMKWTECALC